jgi:hypothetical protein
MPQLIWCRERDRVFHISDGARYFSSSQSILPLLVARVHLTVGNRSVYRSNQSNRSGSVKKLGYRSLNEPSKPLFLVYRSVLPVYRTGFVGLANWVGYGFLNPASSRPTYGGSYLPYHFIVISYFFCFFLIAREMLHPSGARPRRLPPGRSPAAAGPDDLLQAEPWRR